ncbi:dTDP-4-amino-4,6-dideoxygalactose transaminase [Shewanella sp. HL-SH4]|uniref:dTDP-4-amino-4,6-dideoxygalactose transaminase n=1 Tax=Shewanella sp. HL-SH4 TaxID=3436240 RepID=UPI003EB80CAE
MIPFNRPPVLGTEIQYIADAIQNGKLCGDGPYGHQCQSWLEKEFKTLKALLTPSCTAALEMGAILADIKEGDEVIMPSFTFVSTANAFVLRGAKIVFVDIRPDTMNIDEKLIEAAITSKTKAIVPVHYAGIGCEMDIIMTIANRHNLWVIEDAAQGVMSTYKGKALGTIGHIGCFSFHETKNYSAGGEGGAILINDESLIHRAEVIREKGTDRSQFIRGQVDKYTWKDIGSSFLPSELQGAYLFAQLEAAEQINDKRLLLWNTYQSAFQQLIDDGKMSGPTIPQGIVHNAHMYYLKLEDQTQRDAFILYMREHDILTVFHYIPLHSSPAGENHGVFHGEDKHTTLESQKLVRLPLYYQMTQAEQQQVITAVSGFFCAK